MAKKSRLKTDAFDWVQDTTKKTKAEPPAEPKTQRLPEPVKAPKTTPKSAPKAAKAKESKPRREAATVSRAPLPDAPVKQPVKQEKRVFVQYLRPKGEIVAMQELRTERRTSEGFMWLQLPKDRDAAEIVLTGELAKMALIDIHKNFKVEKSGKTAKLVRKR